MKSTVVCILIMICSELLASTSQILLKKSANRTYESRIGEYLNRFVITGYGMLFVSMMLSILAFRAADSYMNIPVLETMGYIFVMILGRIVFGEAITRKKLLGMSLIFTGILIYYLL